MSGSENSFLMMLESMTGTKWIIIGILLLILEVITGTTYILWTAIAAILVGVIAFILPVMGWEGQFILFFVLSAALLVIGHTHIRPRLKSDAPSDLNDRATALLGRRVKAIADFDAGEGRVRVGDTQWRARSVSGQPKAGEELVVNAVKGTTLMVDALVDTEPNA